MRTFAILVPGVSISCALRSRYNVVGICDLGMASLQFNWAAPTGSKASRPLIVGVKQPYSESPLEGNLPALVTGIG